MFNWADIRMFLELARQQSLSKTAGSLRVDISTVSRRIAELERNLNCKLFERSSTGFTLTVDGTRLLPHAEEMETSASNIAYDMADGAARTHGIVRIASMGEGFSALALSPLLARFQKQEPQIGIEIAYMNHTWNLGRRETDIAITIKKLEGSKLQCEMLGVATVKLYASDQYLAQHGQLDESRDLGNHRFIDYLDAAVEISELGWLKELVPESKATFCSTSLVAQQQAARSGAGIVALPVYAATGYPDLVEVAPERSTSRPLWITVHTDTEFLPRIRAVANYLKAEVPNVLAGLGFPAAGE
ncbi:LysR family transcriptional regulator [Caballeronia sordidicola]|uniref:LysR family transcriptional regulator n=1 Tax=Caballeronia sordidicola TaxID=196367 RepID=UPI000A3BBEC8|nr:LysR family transcriptional regulator [Caballeronia sordidicola]